MTVRTAVAGHRTALAFLAGVTASVAVLGASVAIAQIPSSKTGEITACVANKSGAVRVIDYQSGKRCKTTESRVTWSQGYTYRGAWSATTQYSVDDVVVHDGSSYVAAGASEGVRPGGADEWQLLAARGATGPAGPAKLPRAKFYSQSFRFYFSSGHPLERVDFTPLPVGNWVVVVSFSVGATADYTSSVPAFHVYCEVHNTDDSYAGGADAVMRADDGGNAATNMTINAGMISTGARGQDASLYCRGESLNSDSSNVFMWLSVNQFMVLEVGSYV